VFEVVHPDIAIAALARRQHGIVTWRQLIGAGIGRGAIESRVASGRLVRVHRGVFLSGAVMPPLGREHAAVLALGERALLSHRSAAAVHSLLPEPDGAVEVTVVGRRPPQRRGVRVHYASDLPRRDRARRHGIAITGAARTLLDVAETCRPREAERAYDEAITRRLVAHKQLCALIERSPGRRGIPVLRALLDRDAPPALTDREAEERLLTIVRAAGLPAPECNVWIGPYRVDFYWRGYRLVVEVDSHAWHSSPQKFESDRRRDQQLQAQGIAVMRVTWFQITRRPFEVVAALAQALGRAA
jgi:very-short-patch-repair endonuclease